MPLGSGGSGRFSLFRRMDLGGRGPAVFPLWRAVGPVSGASPNWTLRPFLATSAAWGSAGWVFLAGASVAAEGALDVGASWGRVSRDALGGVFGAVSSDRREAVAAGVLGGGGAGFRFRCSVSAGGWCWAEVSCAARSGPAGRDDGSAD